MGPVLRIIRINRKISYTSYWFNHWSRSHLKT